MRWEITKAGVIFSLIYQPCSLLRSETALQDLRYDFNKALYCLYVWGLGGEVLLLIYSFKFKLTFLYISFHLDSAF